MVFSGAGAAFKGKLIQSITLTITSSGAGSGSSSKKLTFHKANYQSLNTGVRGSAHVGATLGTLTGKFYSNTVTHMLNASTNAEELNDAQMARLKEIRVTGPNELNFMFWDGREEKRTWKDR